MPPEPAIKRTMAFFDGQNLFHAAKEAFGYTFPNYDPQKLASRICQSKSWNLQTIKFYTGIPDQADKPNWNHFWRDKLAVMGTRGIVTFTRPLRYRNQAITLPNGTTCTALVGVEKGIDVRIALDILRAALDNEYDVALVFSQDQDLSEAADEVRKVSMQQQRWIKVVCAFPFSPIVRNRRGINNTEWFKISRQDYDVCIDPNDYRQKTT